MSTDIYTVEEYDGETPVYDYNLRHGRAKGNFSMRPCRLWRVLRNGKVITARFEKKEGAEHALKYHQGFRRTNGSTG